MANTIFLIVDVLIVIISLFCIYTSYSIYMRYNLVRTLAFVITSFGILLWNISHVFYDNIPSDNLEWARTIWYIANITGAVVVVSTIHGFSTIRNEHLPYRLVFYYITISVFLTAQLLRRDILDLEYNSVNQQWQTVTANQLMWNLYIAAIFIMLVIELYYPLIVAYKNIKSENRNMLILLLVGAILATLSNLLLPILAVLDLPQDIRNITANLGLLAVFWVLYKHPFLGFYDEVQIHQVIITNASGLPIFYTNDDASAFLASSGLYGVNTILTEIADNVGIEQSDSDETIRKIELPDNQFYITNVNEYNIVFHYSNHSGTSLSKFKSLTRIFCQRDLEVNELISVFQRDFNTYFPNLNSLMVPKDPSLVEKIIQ